MSYIVIRCADCTDPNGRPKLYRFACDDCRDDFINRHRTDFPDHRLESSEWLRDWVRPASRSTRRLTRRAGGW